MAEEKSTREMIYETNRDVKWICRTLERMEEQDCDFENRLRDIEGWKQMQVGEERRDQRINASAGGIMGGVVAVVVRFIWGG
jgi:hypothetical protein